MPDWGLIGVIIAIFSLIFFIWMAIYTWKYKPRIPKPDIRFKELFDPNDNVQFVIPSDVKEPVMKNYFAYYKAFYEIGGKKRTMTTNKYGSTTDANYIHIDGDGTWRFPNFLTELRKQGAKINGMIIKVLFEDTYKRKYCYCYVFKPIGNGKWRFKEPYVFHNYCKHFKCMFCLVKKNDYLPNSRSS